jgi:hypothetical protein
MEAESEKGEDAILLALKVGEETRSQITLRNLGRTRSGFFPRASRSVAPLSP